MAVFSTFKHLHSPAKPHEARSVPKCYVSLKTVTNGSINDVKVVILSSANLDIFIDHIDIHALSAASPESPPANGTLTGIQLLSTRSYLQTLPIASVAEINGRTTGAGNEVAVQCNIRYARPGAKLPQLEIGFGELPGTGGLQFLGSLIGRARALKYILSARRVDAIEAAAIGWVNRAFGSDKELKEGVTELAERIAIFLKQDLAAIKSRINVQKPAEADIKGYNSLFTQLEKTKVVQDSTLGTMAMNFQSTLMPYPTCNR